VHGLVSIADVHTMRPQEGDKMAIVTPAVIHGAVQRRGTG
jgi:hypothetical protein